MPGALSRGNRVTDSFLAYLSESIVIINIFRNKLNIVINTPGLQTIFIHRYIETNENNTSRDDRTRLNDVFILYYLVFHLLLVL